MLDRLRHAFPYVIAVLLPLVGAIIAAVSYAQGDRDGALRVALAVLLGAFLYAALLT